MERYGGITQPKRNDIVYKLAIMCYERRFVAIPSGDFHLVILQQEIQLGISLGSGKHRANLINARMQERVFSFLRLCRGNPRRFSTICHFLALSSSLKRTNMLRGLPGRSRPTREAVLPPPLGIGAGQTVPCAICVEQVTSLKSRSGVQRCPCS